MSIVSNLYPPIVPDTIPPFLKNADSVSSYKINFSLAPYTKVEDIANVQVSLTSQRTNASILKRTSEKQSEQEKQRDPSLHPTGILIAELKEETNPTNNFNYYIQINKTDLEGEKLGDQFYKVQMRFTGRIPAEIDNIPINPADNDSFPGGKIAKWLETYKDYFSEWSSVCLIKGIDTPQIYLRNFDDVISDGQEDIVLSNSIGSILGRLYYADNSQEQEYLKSYSIRLYEKDNQNNVLFNSGEVYTNIHNPNQINYQLTYNLIDSVKYKLVFDYATNNLYTGQKQYVFTVIEQSLDKLNATIKASLDKENGRIKIDLTLKSYFLGNIMFRRASSKTDFKYWEDVHIANIIQPQQLTYTWYDNTVESGVWYKYCAQRINKRGDRGPVVTHRAPVFCEFEDMYLSGDGRILKIKFNPSLNQFKYNVIETQQTALGSKYPYVKRNGSTYYRSFPIGGLISFLMDTSNWYDPHFNNGIFETEKDEIKQFTSREEVYKDSKYLYDEYNVENNVPYHQDIFYEKNFRDKIYDFLYSPNAKLFRSTTEGNILVRLMDINFQPTESLGRMVYAFTANALEIDESSINNYEKYNIQSIGECNDIVSRTYNALGQINGYYSSSNGNLIETVLQPKYTNQTPEGYSTSVQKLKWVRITFNSPSYSIVESASGLVLLQEADTYDPAMIKAGYVIKINNTEFLVPASIERHLNNNEMETLNTGYFEIGDQQNNFDITSIEIKYGADVQIDYVATIQQTEEEVAVAKQFYYITKPGQLYGTFEPGKTNSIMNQIQTKYLQNYSTYYQRLVDVAEVAVQGPQGCVLYVKQFDEDNYKRYVLEDGYLKLDDEDMLIEDMYFNGVNLTRCTDWEELTRVNGLTELVEQPGYYQSLNEITNPVNGGIYYLQNISLDDVVDSENPNILIVSEDLTEHEHVSQDQLYTLLLDRGDDPNAKFIYYYGVWYMYATKDEITGLQRDDIRHVRLDEYIEMNETYNSTEEIQPPQRNGVYTIGNKQMIYYHDKWYDFTENHNVICPIDGIVNYFYIVVKGVY